MINQPTLKNFKRKKLRSFAQAQYCKNLDITNTEILSKTKNVFSWLKLVMQFQVNGNILLKIIPTIKKLWFIETII